MDSCGQMKNSTPTSATSPKLVEVLLPPPKISVGNHDCPDDGRAKHQERHDPAPGEPFTSHEGVLEPAQEGESKLVPIDLDVRTKSLVLAG